MNKQHILDEIKRTADENDGAALGLKRFEAITGISRNEILGKHWARWGDALVEAGYERHELQGARDDNEIIGHLVTFIRELGRYPTVMEIRLRAKQQDDFPWHNTFARLGNKSEVAGMALRYCQERDGLEDVIAICEPVAAQKPKPKDVTPETGADGFVYLMKSGKHYKIGFTNSVDRRRYELGPKLPLGIEPIHSIRTDDPAGIEAYWHRRFKDKHLNGEWFDLSTQDVATFKRRKFM